MKHTFDILYRLWSHIFHGILVMGFLVSGTLIPSWALQPWQSWARNPLTIPVTVSVNDIYAGSGSDVAVVIEDVQVTTQGTGYGTAANASPSISHLGVRREYQLTITATDLSSLSVTLTPHANWTPLSPYGRAAQPKEYHVMVDRELKDGPILVQNPIGQGSYSQSWTIEITERLPGQWRLEDGGDDPDPAPGEAMWAQLGPGKSLDKSKAAISWSVSVGRMMDGLAAGRLSLRESGLSTATYTPASIYFAAGSSVARDEAELVTESPTSATLRQVKAFQCFVDIVSLANSTELRFYFPSQIGSARDGNGVYTGISGSPFVIWEVLNPQPGTTTHLQIIEHRNGASSVTDFIYDPNSLTATWTLKYGSAPEQRIETRGVNINSPLRVETVDIRYSGAASAAYKATETYKLMPWGELELVETRSDPDGNPGTANDLVTTMTFYEDPADEISYKQLKSITYPDGYWEKRIYDVYPYDLIVLRPFGDAASSPETATYDNSVVVQHLGPGWTVPSYHPPHIPGDIDEREFREQSDGRGESGVIGVEEHYSLRWITHPFGNYTALGQEEDIPDESRGPGSCNHPLVETDTAGPAKISYFNSVTYYPASGSYDLHPEKQLWEGPDWRQCTLYTSIGNPGVFNDDEANVVECRFADGQELYDPVDFGWQIPRFLKNRTWRDSFVYHEGSLALKEKHILTDVSGDQPLFDYVSKWVYQNDTLGHPISITWVDGRTGVSRVIYSADYKGNALFDGDLKLWEKDEQGIRTIFQYDSLKRLQSKRKEVPGGSDVVTTFAYDAYGRVTSEVTTAAALSAGTSTSFDLAGRIISQSDTNALTTSYVYALGGRRTIKTLPSGRTEIRENYLDRTLKSVTGTGAVREYHSWAHANGFGDGVDPYTWSLGTWHTVHFGSESSPRVTWEGLDWVDRPILTRKPDAVTGQVVEEYRLADLGRPALYSAIYRTTGADQVSSQMWNYDFDGYTNAYVIFGQAPGFQLPDFDSDLGSDHRMTRTIRKFEKIGTDWFQTTTQQTYRSDWDSTPTVLSVTRERLNGFTSGNTLSEVQAWDVDNNLTTITTTADQSARRLTEVTDVPYSALNVTKITIGGLLRSETTPSVSQPIQYGYDALERLTSVVNSESFPATTVYNANNQVQSTADFTGVTTIYSYYPNGVTGAGMIQSKTCGGKSTYLSYTDRGEIYRVWGDVPYPEEHVYSIYGEPLELHTFQGGSGWNGASWPASTGSSDVTTWAYHPDSGLLMSKTDHLNHTVSYSYDYGLLHTRTSARSSVTAYTYNELGEVTGITYDDGTPSVAYVNSTYPTFNRRGLPRVVTNASGEWNLEYDQRDRLLRASCASGLFAGITMANHFDPVQGRDWLKVQVGGQDRLTQAYSYDPNSGRLKTASYGNYSSSYAYRANSDLLQTISGKYLETTASTTTYDWDYGVRVKSVQNSGSGLLSSHTYIYDPLGRRRSTALMDGSHWEYGYNDRNELTSGKHYWSDGSFVASQQFEYGYDSIGNRDYTRSGGDGAGNNLRFADYTANGLNQYSVRGVPGTVDITGLATEGQTVTVNGQNASRHADYFSAAAVLNTGGAPVSQSVTVQLLGSGGTSTSGRMTMPGSSESFIYDNDGNLSEDSLWTYGWDGENRLIRATRKAITGMPSADRKELTFAYDDRGRRISRTVAAWNGVNAFINPITTKFLYDGWNLIAELDQSNNLIRSYLWGLDLSGSRPDEEQEAGGIGGLLLVTDHASNASHFTGYDGSGNIVVLVNGSTGEASARYQYSPFGQLIQATGPMAKINPFRWSTKYWDEETGLSYYGLRYYSPALGRWLNPDPIGEEGGPNLYAFIANSPANLIDPHGAMLLDFLIGASEDVEGKTAELATKTTYIERVRSAVKNMENLQMFIAGIEEADDNQFIDLIEDINQLQGLAAEGFRGSKSMAKRSHHLTPQAKEFAHFFDDASLIPDNFTKEIPKWQHDALHQLYKGEYDGRGGPWNEIWRRAKGSDDSRWKNKYFVAGFAAGITKRTALNLLPLP